MGRTWDITKDTVKGTASDMAYGASYIAKDIDRSIQPDPPAANTATIEHAQRTAAANNDMPTIKSTLGMHPVESHFQSSGPRHALGRGLPSDHPALAGN